MECGDACESADGSVSARRLNDDRQCQWDEAKVSIEWLEAMLDTASADAISISIDHKKVKGGDPQTALLLAQIEYEETVSTIWSVSLSAVSES